MLAKEEDEEICWNLHVLAVDDDLVCLTMLKAFLVQCGYRVTGAMDSLTAIKLLRENKDHDKFDIVITNVHMRNMDGFGLLKIIGLEMDLPVIMLSANEDHQTVMKGIRYGACDYLLKPVRLEEIKNIWQHVVRKNNKINPSSPNTQGGIMNQTSRPLKRLTEEDDSTPHMGVDPPMQKKTRIVWSSELHHKFVEVFYKIGKEKAIPSKILELMNSPGLTRAQVASHLQKYRKVLEKGESQEANTMIASITKGGPSNANISLFKCQHPNELNSCGGIGANNYCSSAMLHTGHGMSNSNEVPNYQMNHGPPMFPFNQLNVAPQRPQTLENNFYNCEMAKFPGLGEFPSLSGFPSSHQRHFSSDLGLLEGIQHSYGEAFVQSGQVAPAIEDPMSDPLVEDNSFYFSGSNIDDLHEVLINKHELALALRRS
ncbi:hypothetical protein Sjap_016147 [Stephania japonica]|uniref:Two-component response regulator n=1 Tax=Stephania japonica TaxID=461633 RepID=A0AAP0IKZ6_9MAGN